MIVEELLAYGLVQLLISGQQIRPVSVQSDWVTTHARLQFGWAVGEQRRSGWSQEGHGWSQQQSGRRQERGVGYAFSAQASPQIHQLLYLFAVAGQTKTSLTRSPTNHHHITLMFKAKFNRFDFWRVRQLSQLHMKTTEIKHKLKRLLLLTNTHHNHNPNHNPNHNSIVYPYNKFNYQKWQPSQ